MKKIILFFVIILLSSSCEVLFDKGYRIRVENNSNDTIQFYESYIYPDTSIVREKPILKMACPNKHSYIGSREKWKDVLHNDTISVFLISKDTFDTYGWGSIKFDYNILIRYDLSLKDLENMNWTVTYP